MILATGISVTPDSLEISEGATAQLSVELTPPDSTDAISYESDARLSRLCLSRGLSLR